MAIPSSTEVAVLVDEELRGGSSFFSSSSVNGAVDKSGIGVSNSLAVVGKLAAAPSVSLEDLLHGPRLSPSSVA